MGTCSVDDLANKIHLKAIGQTGTWVLVRVSKLFCCSFVQRPPCIGAGTVALVPTKVKRQGDGAWICLLVWSYPASQGVEVCVCCHPVDGKVWWCPFFHFF